MKTLLITIAYFSLSADFCSNPIRAEANPSLCKVAPLIRQNCPVIMIAVVDSTALEFVESARM